MVLTHIVVNLTPYPSLPPSLPSFPYLSGGHRLGSRHHGCCSTGSGRGVAADDTAATATAPRGCAAGGVRFHLLVVHDCAISVAVGRPSVYVY